MTLSQKQRVLIGIGRRGRLDDTRELVTEIGNDTHNIIHLLYSLRRDGLIKFYRNTNGTVQRPCRIQLTPKGEKTYQELTQ